VTNWGNVVSIISWVAPLLAIVGGIVTFSNPRAGALLLAASAGLLWYLLGLGLIGKIFVLPIGAAAVLGWIAGSSKSDTASGHASPANPQALPAEPASTTSPPHSELMPATAGFDRGRWDALAKYDPDIAPVVERVRPLGQKWIDELATSYLALNDKTYLASIEQKIAAAAKAEADELAIQNARAEGERNTQVEEQEHRVQEQLLERERLADAQRRRLEELREMNWGTPRAKLKTLAIVGVPLLGAALIWLAAGYWDIAQQEKDYHAALTDLSDTEITLLSDKVDALGEGIHEWRGWVTRNTTTTIVGGPADSTRAFKVAGALSAAFSRSKLGDCESRLLLGVSKLADAQFKCSAWPFLAWKINKSPHSRLASLTVSFAGAAGNDKFVAPAGAQYQLYALDLQGATTRSLARGSFASVVAISPLGDRALAVLPDGIHVFDLVSGRDFVSKASHSSSACAGLEASFTNDQGTQFLIRRKTAGEVGVVPIYGPAPVERPAVSWGPCPRGGRYDVTADGVIVFRGQ
jgi:hypothetical protein